MYSKRLKISDINSAISAETVNALVDSSTVNNLVDLSGVFDPSRAEIVFSGNTQNVTLSAGIYRVMTGGESGSNTDAAWNTIAVNDVGADQNYGQVITYNSAYVLRVGAGTVWLIGRYIKTVVRIG